MSNLSLKSAFKEDKFNLKTISILFLLVDISLIGFIEPRFFFYLVLYQVSLIITLMFGLRGQGKYKTMMLSLQSIARNRELSVDEREMRLVNGIHHYCLELGYIYEERNKEYGLRFNKKKAKKKTKNLEVKKEMIRDETVNKQVGYLIVGIWGFLGLALLDMLINLWGISPLWIFAITGIYYCVDGFVLFYVHYVFNIEPVQVENPRAIEIKSELEKLEAEK